ncbi:hypothetical protein VYU27_004386 [Nannochloropsis oceanica]
MATTMKGVVVSCAAPDDDPLEHGLGVCVQSADGLAANTAGGEGVNEEHNLHSSSRLAFFLGEMGEGQMHGLGRVEMEEETYVGFWERGLYHGQGLLLDHEMGSRSEGRFAGGLLVEGSSTSMTVDREGKRDAEGGLLGRGVKVLRGAQPPQQQQQQQELEQGQQQQWKKVLKGTFQGDLLHGRGSMWLCHARKATKSFPPCAVAAPAAPPAPPAAAAPAAALAATSFSADNSVETLVRSRSSGVPHHSLYFSSASSSSSSSSSFQNAEHHQEGTGDDTQQQQQQQQQQVYLDLRLEAVFEEGAPCFGRAFFSDGRVYIGRLDRRERRRGLGFTVTKAGKAVIASREGDKQVGYGLVLDFASHTYRRTPAGSTQIGEEVKMNAAALASASAASTAARLPSFWNQEGVLGLLKGAMVDPVAAWGTLEAFSKALREEQARLLNETPPRITVGPYVRKLTVKETAASSLLATLYQGEKDKEGRREGQGVGLLLPSGDIFKGTWVKDAPEGRGTWVSLVNKDVFKGELERGGVVWKAGRWCSLSGWRVEATKWLYPRVPHGFVTVRAPFPSMGGEYQWQQVQQQRAVVEAFYRIRGTGDAVTVKRDDMDVRITIGPEGGRRIFRGRVYPSPVGSAASMLLEIPRPRNGLEYREKEHGSMYELVYDEDGVMIGNRIAVLRHADGSTEFGGEFMEIMSNAPMDYHKNHVKQQSVRAEKEWPGKLLGSFETHYTGAVGGDESMPGGGAHPKQQQQQQQQQQQHTHAAGLLTTDMTVIATITASGRYHYHPSPSSPEVAPVLASATSAPVSVPESLKEEKSYEQQEQQRGQNEEQELKENKGQALTTLRGAGPAQKTRLASFLPGLVRATAKANKRITAAQQKATSRAFVKEQRLQQQQQQLLSKQVGNAEERRRRKSLTSASQKVGTQSFKALQESDDDDEEEKMIKKNEEEEDDREGQGGDLMNHSQVCSRLDNIPPLVIPEMRSDDIRSHSNEDSLRASSTTLSSLSPLVTSSSGRCCWASLSAPEGEFQVVASKSKSKGKGASKNGNQQHQQQARTPWTPVTGALSIKPPPSHKKNALSSGGNPPPGMPAMKVLCIVEAGWQAAHVRIFFRTNIPEVKVMGYRVIVHRTERALPGSKDYKTVESVRSEFPILGLQNHVKYNFAPSARVLYRQHTWRVQGDVVRTSPPGPVKHKPTNTQQPFLRRLNEKGKLMPNDDNGYWQWARYISGHELSPDLAPMKAFALKAHVMQGDEMLRLELDLAKELHGHIKALLVWVHPAAEPGLVSSGKHVCEPFVEGEPFCAVVSGLSNEKKYHVAFRVMFSDGSYPPGDGIIILPGRPIAEAGGGVGKQIAARPRSSSSASSSPSSIPLGDVQQKQQRHEEWPTLTAVSSAAPGEGTDTVSAASAAAAAVFAAEEADATATTAARGGAKILLKPSSISPFSSLELPYRAAVTMPKLMSQPPGLASSKEKQKEGGVVLTPLPHWPMASPLLEVNELQEEREEGREDDKRLPLASCNREATWLRRELCTLSLAPTSQPRQARDGGGREEGRENVKGDNGDAGLSVDVDDIFRMVDMEALTFIHDDDEGEQEGGNDNAEGFGVGDLLKRLKEKNPEVAQKEQTAEEKEHVFLFKRQAGSDPEFRGTLTGAVVGRQPGQQQFLGLPPMASTPFSAGNLVSSAFHPELLLGGRGGESKEQEKAGDKDQRGGGGKGLAYEPFWSLPSALLLPQKEGVPLMGMGRNRTMGSFTSSASSSAGSSPEQLKTLGAAGAVVGGTASTRTHLPTRHIDDLGHTPLSQLTSLLQQKLPDRLPPSQQQQSQQQEQQQQQEAACPGKTKTDLTASAPTFCLATQRPSSSSSSFSASPARTHACPTLGPVPIHSQAARHLPPHYTPAQVMMYAQQNRYGSPPPPPSLAAQSSAGHGGGNISYHGPSGIISRHPSPPALANGNSIIRIAAYPPPPPHAQTQPPPASVHYHHPAHTSAAPAAGAGLYHCAATSHSNHHHAQAQAPVNAPHGGYGHSHGQHGPGTVPSRFQSPLHPQLHSHHHHHHPHYPPHHGYH